jgi:putative phosphoesterase
MNSRRILLISDTHGRLKWLPDALRKAGRIDMVLHMGDSVGGLKEIEAIAKVPVIGVRGNCDYMTSLDRDVEINISGIPVFITHGHNYYVGSGLDMLQDEAERRCVRIACFGHTHVPFCKEINGIIYVNPGSLSQPRQEGHKPSYALLEIDEEGRPSIVLRCL